MVGGGSNRRPEIVVFAVDGIEYLPKYYSMTTINKNVMWPHTHTHTKSFTIHRTRKSRIFSVIYFDHLKRNIAFLIFLYITFILGTGRGHECSSFVVLNFSASFFMTMTSLKVLIYIYIAFIQRKVC